METDEQLRDRLILLVPEGAWYTAEDIGNASEADLDALAVRLKTEREGTKMDSKNNRKDLGHMAACLSDLVAHCFALSSESESGALLDQRALEIRASAGSLLKALDRVVTARKG
jgi:hypothetical protein